MLKWLRENWVAVVVMALTFAYATQPFVLSFERYQDHQKENYSAANQAPIESEQDRAARTVAHYTEVLAWFTGALAIVGAVQGILILWQGMLTKRSVGMAERTLTDLERPYLFVTGLQWTSVSTPISLSYEITNQGKLAAIVEGVSIRCGTELNGQFPPRAIIGDHPLLSAPIIFVTMYTDRFNYTVEPKDTVFELPGSHPVQGLIYQVTVTYRGPFSRAHETAQCWRFSQTQRGFVEVLDPNFTYMR